MNIHSITFLIKKMSRQFAHGEILDWFYIGMILFFIGVIIIILVSTLVFLLHAFDAVIFVSDKETTSEIASFNITALEAFAPRFGIEVNNIIPLSPRLQQKKEELSPIPMPSISLPALSGLKLHILNGTGIPGLAKIWKERFETEGLLDVSVGNAPKPNEKGIVMSYKPENETFLEILRKILKENGGNLTHEQVDNTLSYDVLIMIGE